MSRQKGKSIRKKASTSEIKRSTKVSVKRNSSLLKNSRLRKKCDSAGIVHDGASKFHVSPNCTFRRSRRRKNALRNNENQCKVCFLEFSNKYNLQRHVDHFNGSSYPCDVCSTKFPDDKQLEAHVKNAHGGMIVIATTIICHVCKQTFSHETHRQSHIYHYHENGLRASRNKGLGVEKSEDREKKGLYEVKRNNESTIMRRKQSKIRESQENHESTLIIAENIENNETIAPTKIRAIKTRARKKKRIFGSRATRILRARPEDKNILRSRKTKKIESSTMNNDEKILNYDDNRGETNDPAGDDYPSDVLLPSLDEFPVVTTDDKNDNEKLPETMANNEKNIEIRATNDDPDRCAIDENLREFRRDSAVKVSKARMMHDETEMSGTKSPKIMENIQPKSVEIARQNDEMKNERMNSNESTTEIRVNFGINEASPSLENFQPIPDQLEALSCVESKMKISLENSPSYEENRETRDTRVRVDLKSNESEKIIEIDEKSREIVKNRHSDEKIVCPRIVGDTSGHAHEINEERNVTLEFFEKKKKTDKTVIIDDANVSEGEKRMEETREILQNRREVSEKRAEGVEHNYEKLESKDSHESDCSSMALELRCVKSSKKCLHNKKKRAKPQRARYNCVKSTNGIRKRSKRMSKNAATKLNKVLAQVAALFSGMNVNLPEENHENNEIPGKIVSHDVAAGDNLQNNAEAPSCENVSKTLSDNIEESTELDNEVSEYFSDETKFMNIMSNESRNFGDSLVKIDDIIDKSVPYENHDLSFETSTVEAPVSFDVNDEKSLETSARISEITESNDEPLVIRNSSLDRIDEILDNAAGSLENLNDTDKIDDTDQIDGTDHALLIHEKVLGVAERKLENNELRENLQRSFEKTENTDKPSVINEMNFTLPEVIQENDKSSESSGNFENIDNGHVINDTRFDSAEKLRLNDEPAENSQNFMNIVNPLLITDKSVDVLEKISENDKSLENKQNFEQTMNLDDSSIINDNFLDVPEKILEFAESFENLKILKEMKNIDKTSVINDTSLSSTEKIQDNDKTFDSLENHEEFENTDDTTENNKSDEIFKTHEITEITDNESIVHDTSVGSPEKILQNVESSENLENFTVIENIDNELVNNDESFDVTKETEEDDESFGNIEFFREIEDIVNELVINDESFDVPATPKEDNESSGNIENFREIENIDNELVINDTSLGVLEKTQKKDESSEILQNHDIIEAMDYPLIIIVQNLPEKPGEADKSSLNLEIIEKTNYTDNALVINDTSVVLPEKTPKDDNPSEILWNLEEIEDTDNALVVNDTSVDLPEEGQKNEKSSENFRNFEVTENTDNDFVINETNDDLPEKARKNDESFEKIEKTNNVLLFDETSVSVSEKTQKNDESSENSSDLLTIRNNDDTRVIDEHSNMSRFERIIGRIIASLNMSIPPLNKLADFYDDIDPETAENDEKTNHREINEFERDIELRARYSCKHCYVSITRLDIRKTSVRKTLKSAPAVFDESANNSISTSRVIVCKICRLTFSSYASRNRHIADFHTIVRSVICDQQLPNEGSLRRHYRDYHSIGCDENETCVCGKNMHTHEALEQHFFKHSLPNSVLSTTMPLSIRASCRPLKKPHVCPNCGTDFWLKTCLELHSLDCGKSTIELPELVTGRKTTRREFGQGPIDPDEAMCRICYAEFPTSLGLLKHEQTYAKSATHRCHICGTNFMGQRLLNGHTRAAHTFNIDTTYSCYCVICDQGFTKRIYRRIHMMHIHGEKYPTDMINKPTIYNRSAYSEDSVDDISGSKCRKCDLVFVNRKRFIEHAIYYERDETIFCKICDQRFAGQYNAHRHNKFVHYSADMRKAYPHKCTICTEGFMYKRHLKAHVSHVHEKNYDVMNLTRMENYFNDMTNLRATRLHICAICEMSFPSIDLLAAHQIEYQNDGEFVCTRCGKKCRTATLLLDHLSLNHSSTIHDSVKCHRCEENFLTPAAWISHVKHCHIADTREPSEFYLETNIATIREFGMSEFELIPTNNEISSGMTYEKMRDKIDGDSYPEKIVASSIDERIKIIASRVDTPCVIDVTSDVESTSDVEVSNKADVTRNVRVTGDADIEIIEEMIKPLDSREIIKDERIVDEKYLKCDICEVKCRGPIDLMNHNARYADDGPYMCEVCARRFATMRFYQEHRLKHYRPDARDNNLCAICDESFDTILSLKMHKAHVHERKREKRQFKVSLNLKNIPTDAPASFSSVSLCPSLSDNPTCSIPTESISNRQTIVTRKPSESIAASPSHGASEKIARDKVPKSSTVPPNKNINKTLYIYQCPDCSVKYFTLEKLREHLRSVHESTLLDNIDTDIHAKSVFKRRATDNAATYSKVFKFDPEKVISKASIDRSKITSDKKLRSVPDKLYIINGANPRTSLTDCSTENISKDSTAESTNQSCRYETLFRCEFCDLLLNDQDSLNSHRENLHDVRSGATRLDVEPKHPTDKDEILNITLTKSIGPNTVVPIDPRTLIAPSSSRRRTQAPRKITMKIPVHQDSNEGTTGPIAKSLGSNSRVLLKCNACDFFFPSSKMLKLHEERVHSSSSLNIKCIDISNSKEDMPVRSENNNSIVRVQSLVNNLSAVRESRNNEGNMENQRSSFRFEPALMPITVTQLDVPTNPNFPSSFVARANDLQKTVVNSKMDGTTSLKIMKVCSLAKTANNLKSKAVGKRKNVSRNHRETVTKRMKQGFVNPIVHEPLCDKFNLKPVSKAQKDKVAMINPT